MKVTPLEPFGVLIDKDLHVPLSVAEETELVDLFTNHGLLIFNGQSLSRDEQERVCSLLGPLLAPTDPGAGGAAISNDNAKGILGDSGLTWHQDLAFCPEPILGICLQAMTVPEGKTHTAFASGQRGYERLPQDLKDRIADLKVVNSWVTDGGRRARLADVDPNSVRTAHSIVKRNARSDKPFLFVTEQQSIAIEGLDTPAAEALLDEIYAVVYAEDNIYRHYWRDGDLVIWDNVGVSHSRPALVETGERTLQRVTLGTKGFLTQFPELWDAMGGYGTQLIDPLAKAGT
jgi:taurine dioxygenase